VNGRPDASRVDPTDPRRAEYFDWKPRSHDGNEWLTEKDLAQQAGWEVTARLGGARLDPADTMELIPEPRPGGQIVGTNGLTYDVIAYGSDIPGIAYYDLVPTFETRSHAESFGMAMRSAADNINAMHWVIPLLTPPGVPKY
jgi:hypothetical protein